jgi:replicative superfamily II helicase
MDQQQALSTAISLTDEILELLDQGDFERVNELETKRKSYIEQSFAQSIENIDLIKAQHLKNLNQQVVDKLNLFKQSIIIQQSRLRTASKATQAYLNHDSGPR